MSHIIVKKMIGNVHSYAGSEWYYDFKALPNLLQEAHVATFVAERSQILDALVKNWSIETNSQWLVRLFFSVKMIFTASVMLKSAEYSESKNLRISVPYLNYYALLYSLRSMVMVLPEISWQQGKKTIINIGHKHTIDTAYDVLEKIDAASAKNFKQVALSLKTLRELISYRAPSSAEGAMSFLKDIDIVQHCRLFVEMAQLMSELLEKALLSSYNKEELLKFGLDNNILQHAYRHKIDDVEIYDKEDAHRIKYFERKYPVLANIMHMMSEGHVEDAFGAWCSDNDDEDEQANFNPDAEWRVIFDVP